MNCIVVEDEPAAQMILAGYIDRCPGLTCSGVFPHAFSAQEYLDGHTTDLMFLDINLPEMSGISFLRSLVHPPLIIFTTAYQQYALDGYDLEIIDFLLKPFSYERFSKAVNKAKEIFNQKSTLSAHWRITVKAGKKIYRINPADILFVESCGDYVVLQFQDKRLTVHGTLKEWEEKLDQPEFLRVHRTIIVNFQKIEHIDGNTIVTGRHKLPVAESYRAILLDNMTGRNKT